jgi:hypothetical protein
MHVLVAAKVGQTRPRWWMNFEQGAALSWARLGASSMNPLSENAAPPHAINIIRFASREFSFTTRQYSRTWHVFHFI